MGSTKFAPIPDYPEYLVGSDGTIWSEKRKKYLALQKMHKGYLQVTISKKNRLKTFRVNRLVLICHIGPAPSDKHQAAHKNGDRLNNQLENLYWATPHENAQDRKRHGNYAAGFDHPMAKLSRGDLVYAKWRRKLNDTWADIGKDVGVGPDAISRRVRSAEMAGEI